MKNLRIKIAILALLVGVSSAFAFKPAKPASQFWLYSNHMKSDTDPTAYVASTNSCGVDGNICGIEAPADPAHPAQPTINSALSTRITNLDTSDSDVFLEE